MNQFIAVNDEMGEPLETLVDEFVQRIRQGELPSVDDYAQRFPQMSDEIRELFPTIASMERLKLSKERQRPDGRVSLGAATPKQLGDFRLVYEIGRGGMGVVYEAEQESLRRRVAVKLLPRRSLDTASQIERFQQEARTAARLHHTNIVPVFGVGEHEGFHYYVMQLIRGIGLDEVLANVVGSEPTVTQPQLGAHTQIDSPDDTHPLSGNAPPGTGIIANVRAGKTDLAPRTVARLGKQAAEALQYAHEQGVLHRDIKPGNLLIDTHGVLFVTDFGLAKVLDENEEAAHERLVGTLRFMAPEQFRGAVDVRTDIYSLGVTLYELLTRRPAFGGADRAAVLKNIQQGNLVPPRQCSPLVPRDLEAIVMKAAACSPAQRYATAQELADDLTRWLEDRPIRARKISLVERLRFWSRRNPAVATLSAVAGALLLAIMLVTSVAYVRTRNALAGEKLQRSNSEQTAELAFAALDQVFESFAPRRWSGPTLAADGETEDLESPPAPMLTNEAAAVLDDLLVFYDKLAQQAGSNPQYHLRAAEARHRVGQIHQQLGHLDQAVSAYQTALDDFRKSDSEHNDSPVQMARVFNDLGWLHRLRGENDAADETHFQARNLLKDLGPPRSSAVGELEAEKQFELAHTYYLLGRRVRPMDGKILNDAATERMPPHAGRPPHERDSDRPPPPPPPRGPEGLDHSPGFGGPPGKKKGPPPFPAGLPERRSEHGGPARPPQRHEESPELRIAVQLLEDLVAKYPSQAKYRHLLALCNHALAADGFPREGQPGFQEFQHSISLLEQLVKDFPSVPEYQFDLAEAYSSIDIHRVDPQDWAAACQSIEKGIAITEPLLRANPNSAEYALTLSHAFFRLASLRERLAEQGDPQEFRARMTDVEKQVRRAMQIQSRVAKQFPQATSYQAWLGKFEHRLARIIRQRNDAKGARKMFEQTIATLKPLLDKNQPSRFLQTHLSEAYQDLAQVLEQLGERELATEARTQANQLRPPTF